MKAQQLIQMIEHKYPIDIQEPWDHSGLQCGNPHQEVQKVLIALDCDQRTIEEAISQNCDMLITHHPFLFKTLNLNPTTYMGQCIYQAIEHKLVIYSTHTPMDKVSMNNWLAQAINLKEIQTFEESGIAVKGKLQQAIPLNDFIELVKDKYSLEYVKVAGWKEMVESISLCGGSGSDFIDDVNTDVYLTGDLKYHDGEKALMKDIVLIDIGHHAEKIMIHQLKDYLSSKTSIELIESNIGDYYKWY